MAHHMQSPSQRTELVLYHCNKLYLLSHVENRLLPFTVGLQMYIIWLDSLCRLLVIFVSKDKVRRHEISLIASTNVMTEVILVDQWCGRADSAWCKIPRNLCIEIAWQSEWQNMCEPEYVWTNSHCYLPSSLYYTPCFK